VYENVNNLNNMWIIINPINYVLFEVMNIKSTRYRVYIILLSTNNEHYVDK